MSGIVRELDLPPLMREVDESHVRRLVKTRRAGKLSVARHAVVAFIGPICVEIDGRWWLVPENDLRIEAVSRDSGKRGLEIAIRTRHGCAIESMVRAEMKRLGLPDTFIEVGCADPNCNTCKGRPNISSLEAAGLVARMHVKTLGLKEI